MKLKVVYRSKSLVLDIFSLITLPQEYFHHIVGCLMWQPLGWTSVFAIVILTYVGRVANNGCLLSDAYVVDVLGRVMGCRCAPIVADTRGYEKADRGRGHRGTNN